MANASWKPYFQLVRLPNVFTAAADSLAGWLVVAGSFEQPQRWLPLVGTSMAVYAGGIALNDYFDREIDRVERPNRPLPSGRISARFAAGFGGGLLVLGFLLASLSGWLGGTWGSPAVALALIAAVLAYDTIAKKTVLGPLVMGSCRGLNLLLGMSQASDLGGPVGWSIAGAITLFVAGITILSRSEVGEGKRAGLVLGTIVQVAAILWLGATLAVATGYEFAATWRLVLIAILAAMLLQRDASAIRLATPKTTQRAVVFGVLSLVWWDVAIVLALRGILPALVVASLWVPAYLLAKRIYST